MSIMTAKAFLMVKKPPLIDSAKDFAERFRIVSQRTCHDLLRECGYEFEETPLGKKWVHHESQLDRIERKLDDLLARNTPAHEIHVPELREATG